MYKMFDQSILPNQDIHLFKVNTAVQRLSSKDLWFMINSGLKFQSLRWWWLVWIYIKPHQEDLRFLCDVKIKDNDANT